MIPKTHIESIQERFPKSWGQYSDETKKIDWESLYKWIESKNQDPGYYAIALGKIEKEFK